MGASLRWRVCGPPAGEGEEEGSGREAGGTHGKLGRNTSPCGSWKRNCSCEVHALSAQSWPLPTATDQGDPPGKRDQEQPQVLRLISVLPSCIRVWARDVGLAHQASDWLEACPDGEGHSRGVREGWGGALESCSAGCGTITVLEQGCLPASPQRGNLSVSGRI